ncbi:MAG: DUF3179 domain-containing protein [Roseivirga sp.]|nr:DUF3179 domain-containing protein [Roseivirga sp.]
MKSRNAKIFTIICMSLLTLACNDSAPSILDLEGDWLIPRNEVLTGAVTDAIPALTDPEMVPVEDGAYIADNELVVGYVNGTDARAYPHKILDWHEIINDNVSGREIAITHCPLTRTSVGWEREYNGVSTTFGVSGLLYQTNLMPYDRTTRSIWSQQALQSVNGANIGTQAEIFHVVETTWGTWKRLYPNTTVVSLNTGHDRDYQRYPYGDYRSAPGLLFRVNVTDSRLPQKERVLGIIENQEVKVYQFKFFEEDQIITDTFNGANFTIIGSKDSNILMAFKEKQIDGEVLAFELINSFGNPVIMQDQLGNQWNIFGMAVSGPNTGEQLEMANAFVGMFFSWAPFYGLPEIYETD